MTLHSCNVPNVTPTRGRRPVKAGTPVFELLRDREPDGRAAFLLREKTGRKWYNPIPALSLQSYWFWELQ